MIEYYKDSDDNYYRLICRANEGSPDGNELAILQGLNEDGKLIAVSSSSRRFKQIDNTVEIKAVLANCPIDLNPKYRFPYIIYQKEMPEMRTPKDGFSKSVQSMITLLSKVDSKKDPNYKYFDKEYLEGLKYDDKVEWEALNRIEKYKDGDNLEEIFHLIQIWGGSSGRNIYVFKNKEGKNYEWKYIEKQYEELVKVCIKIDPKDEGYIGKLVEAVKKANESIPHLGVSFITKHVRFWLYKQLGYNALPIYDSIMAIEVMRKDKPNITDLEEYWNVMVAKANREKVDLMPLERLIFLHALDPTDPLKNRR